MGPANSFFRVNGRIRAREVRVIGADGQQVGILGLGEAINLARAHGMDLVEIAATAAPPVCRIVDYGKFRYEQAKKEKESKKHQHANKVKEVQLSANIDPHDLQVKLSHAVDFLCDEMKVKVTLRFRGREMAHKEFGFQAVRKFLEDIGPWGHADFDPKLNGRTILAMISPLPRNKRAKNPKESSAETQGTSREASPSSARPQTNDGPLGADSDTPSPENGFSNNPFGNIDLPE